MRLWCRNWGVGLGGGVRFWILPMPTRLPPKCNELVCKLTSALQSGGISLPFSAPTSQYPALHTYSMYVRQLHDETAEEAARCCVPGDCGSSLAVRGFPWTTGSLGIEELDF